VSWWARFRDRDRLDRQLDAELRDHLERLVADYIAGGLDEREARRRARLHFGGLDQMMEACRDENALFMLNGAMIQDFKVALRRFVQAPGFTASAVIVLALGIGVNAAVFDLVHTLLFAAPAFSAPSELVQVFSQDKNNQQSYRAFSYPTYRDIREQHGVFTDVAAFDLALIGLGQKGDTRRTMASTVSSNYFSVLGVSLARGRSFTPEEEAPGRSASVAIVSYAYWQRHDLDPAVLGSQVLIQGHPFTIVGIAPQGFTGTTPVMFSVDVWTPLSVYDQMTNDSEPDGRNLLADRAGQQLKVIGRLKPGMTAAGTRPELAGLASNLEKAFPVEQQDQTFTAGPLARFSVSPRPANEAGLRKLGLLLLGMSAVVLLVACLNLANMLLARGMARRKEIAIRLAIGGSRLQIVRQLLIEGFVLALAGGAAGLMLGVWSARLFITSLDRMSPLFGIVWAGVPSIQVLLATLGFCVAATLGFALGPAIKLSRSAVAADLTEQAGEIMTRRRGRLSAGNPLVVIQIAISLALLTAGALFIRGASKATSVDTGLRPGGSMLLETDARLAGFRPGGAQRLYEQLRERLAAMPGVERVAIAATVPFGTVSLSRAIQHAGVRPAAGSKPASAAEGLAFGAAWNSVSAEYFEAVGLPILRGRAFSAAEATQSSGAPVAIVDEILAKQLWPEGNALGRSIQYAADDAPRAEGGGGAGGLGYSDDGGGNPGEMMQVVGVVPAARRGLSDKDPAGQIYVPFAHGYQSDIFYFVRFRPRARGHESVAADMIRRAVRDADPALPVLSLRTFDEHLAVSVQVWFVRAAAALFSTFGGLALVLAVLGLYGVRAYTVARRTREIGIRIALGAERRDILRMFLRESSLTVGSGIALGLLLAAVVGRGLSELLYETGPLDPIAFTTASLLLGAAMLIATWLPARRATRIAPTVALRTE
jgi:predicted permease